MKLKNTLTAAIWRIFKFPIQFRTTPIQRLSFHVEGKKPCYFKLNDDIEEVLEKSENEDSQLTAWFYLNTVNVSANQYLYSEIPGHFTWQDLNLTDADKRNYTLIEIEKLMVMNGGSLSTIENMPQPSRETIDHSNHFIVEEMKYNREEQKEKHDEWVKMLTLEQKEIYDEILDAVLNDKGGVFFVYGFGGTGKTFMWKTLSAALRYRGMIVINTASSGIASLLLPGGRTAHSRFRIPITPDDSTSCTMTPNDDVSNLMDEASLIIWDDAPMMSKYCFENLDRSLKDCIGRGRNKPFGGKVVVFGGDFRQILPVINGAGRAEIVLSSLNASYLWEHCKVLKLTKNMRLLSNKLNEDEARDIEEFSKWILDVGDGKIAEPNDGEALIDIPAEFLITDVDDPIEAISRAIYGDFASLQTKKDAKIFQERAILAPRNDDVNTINQIMLDKLPGEEKSFLSCDSIDPTDLDSVDNPVFTPDFLNSIKISGLPNHNLRLKVRAPIMLLRNLDPKGGLCNGTRLQITQMADHVLEAMVITGDRSGDLVLIPQTFIKPSDTKLPFKMRRRQFPIALAFAMTINKSQGQSLNEVGLFLP
ncbi:PREDICTED: ATP-dependent DNA helicase PIF1-like [Camelina sativa]|uniref:ATP-dependent DNA helicase n=1 Tax=Camelina sativa TaxID=90675 RepID=A0ABM0X588_CAMSA|nr:PREDICTED: ATP-dependent DNA helicase PIF1-like [Camelina sativa]